MPSVFILVPAPKWEGHARLRRTNLLAALPRLPKGGRPSPRAQLSQGAHRLLDRTDRQFFWIGARQEPRPPEENARHCQRCAPNGSILKFGLSSSRTL